MKYLDEFSDPDLAGKLVDQIKAATSQRWAIMEVCGGQTHSIIRHGIDQLLPDTIEMIHGPGCPVCVTPLEIIDKALEIASRPDVIFCSFGDMLRVPGQREGPVPGQEPGRRRPGGVLAAGRAEHRPGEPGQAGGVLRHRLRDHRAGQRDDRLPGQTAWHRELLAAGVACAGAAGDRGDHGVADVPGAGVPGRRARLQRDGHRRSIRRWPRSTTCRSWSPGSSRWTSSKASGARCCSWNRAATSWRTPTRGRSRPRATPPAKAMLLDVFEVTDRAWRGIGMIPSSGWRLSDAYRDFDAEHRFAVTDIHTEESSVCRSGEVLQGLIKPHECAAFGKLVHAAQSAWRHDGLVRGRLRRLLPVPAARGDDMPETPADAGPPSTWRRGCARRRCGTRPTS